MCLTKQCVETLYILINGFLRAEVAVIYVYSLVKCFIWSCTYFFFIFISIV